MHNLPGNNPNNTKDMTYLKPGIDIQANISFKNVPFRKNYSILRNLLFILLILLVGCNNDNAVDIQNVNIDFNSWKIDYDGCLGYRDTISSKIFNAQNKFRGISKKDIIGILGKPNIQMVKSNIFLYYTTKGYHCQHPDSASEAGSLLILFNWRQKVKSIEKMNS